MANPFDACLAPLSRLARRHPDMQGQVIWWEDGGWAAQEDDEVLLDAAEIAYYAEGLLAEGFGLHWQALADPESPDNPILTRLFFWQGEAPAEPALGDWHLVAKGGASACNPSP